MRKLWARFKKWVYAGLISLGLIIPAMAITNFSYDPATSYSDGTAMPLGDIVETRLYCDIDPAGFVPETPGVPASDIPTSVEPGATGSFSVSLMPGNHSCFATHYAANDYESVPSVPVDFRVFPGAPPNPPENLQIN